VHTGTATGVQMISEYVNGVNNSFLRLVGDLDTENYAERL